MSANIWKTSFVCANRTADFNITRACSNRRFFWQTTTAICITILLSTDFLKNDLSIIPSCAVNPLSLTNYNSYMYNFSAVCRFPEERLNIKPCLNSENSDQNAQNAHHEQLHMRQRMTKLTKWHVRPAKTQISLGIRPV